MIPYQYNMQNIFLLHRKKPVLLFVVIRRNTTSGPMWYQIICVASFKFYPASIDWGWRPPQTTSRGSLSTFDTTTAILSGRRTVNLSWMTDRKPRSLLLWSLRMTLVPLATASSTSWWDISPEKMVSMMRNEQKQSSNHQWLVVEGVIPIPWRWM